MSTTFLSDDSRIAAEHELRLCSLPALDHPVPAYDGSDASKAYHIDLVENRDRDLILLPDPSVIAHRYRTLS